MKKQSLSLADKIRNENIKNDLNELSNSEIYLRKELSQVEAKGKKPINKKFYLGSFLLPLFALFCAILYQSDTKLQANGIGDVLVQVLFALVFWIVAIGAFIITPYCIFMSIKELIRTPKRERYLELTSKLQKLQFEKESLESKIIY